MIQPGPPRKVIVATTIFDTYGRAYPGIRVRLDETEYLLDRAVDDARDRYDGRTPDLCVLPEDLLGDKDCEDIRGRSFEIDGAEVQRITEWARANRSYVVLPFVLRTSAGVYHNSAVLIDRRGETVGVYHKMFPVLDDTMTTGGAGSPVFEGGVTPGPTAPVFDTDFGRVGLQICFDMVFNRGWTELTAGGAELVLWPTESPQRSLPKYRAESGGYYIISATTRLNAGVFAPCGTALATVTEDDRPALAPDGLQHGWVLSRQIDLSYVVLNWTQKLEDGELFEDAYGRRVDVAYSLEEDRGIFWSNDPATPIEQMVSELGLEPRAPYLERLGAAADRARTSTNH